MRNTNLMALRQLRTQHRYGMAARRFHITYCILRGRTIDQIESASSNPFVFPDIGTLTDLVEQFYRPLAEGTSDVEYLAEKKAFVAKVKADLTAWKQQISLTWMQAEAKQRQMNRAKLHATRQPVAIVA